ncbi:hypothetical protein OKW22_000997 [Bacilli bacterium PM5-3]|nr:hypothetical protein [Bacilli bacterium PM5-3]MDH6604234.1 hypothetical protein [Bacilli bacterium PM5-9]
MKKRIILIITLIILVLLTVYFLLFKQQDNKINESKTDKKEDTFIIYQYQENDVYDKAGKGIISIYDNEYKEVNSKEIKGSLKDILKTDISYNFIFNNEYIYNFKNNEIKEGQTNYEGYLSSNYSLKNNEKLFLKTDFINESEKYSIIDNEKTFENIEIDNINDDYLLFIYKKNNTINFVFESESGNLTTYAFNNKNSLKKIDNDKDIKKYQFILEDGFDYKFINENGIYIIRDEKIIKYNKSFKEESSLKLKGLNSLLEQSNGNDSVVDCNNNFIIKISQNELLITDENLNKIDTIKLDKEVSSFYLKENNIYYISNNIVYKFNYQSKVEEELFKLANQKDNYHIIVK